MGKSKRSDKEFTREQRLIKENRQLKRELTYLRKEISKLDVDRLETVKEMVADYQEAERLQENLGNPNSNIEDLKKEWACKEPGCSGYLEITIFHKIDVLWYYRKCNSCVKRTRSQKYNSNVKGIVRGQTS